MNKRIYFFLLILLNYSFSLTLFQNSQNSSSSSSLLSLNNNKNSNYYNKENKKINYKNNLSKIDKISNNQIHLLDSITTYITVNYLIDTVSNQTNCDPLFSHHLNSLCNLRSAISYCINFLTVNSFQNCFITLPFNNTIEINSTYGELLITDIFGHISILGNHCFIQPSQNSTLPFQFLSVTNIFKLTISNITFSNFNDFYFFGGVFHIIESSIVILSNINFYSNKGSNGGVIYLSSVTNFTLNHCKFENNEVNTHGGTIYITGLYENYIISNNIFRLNIAHYGNGGAIYLTGEGKSIIIKNCYFTANKAYYGMGGAISNNAIVERIQYYNVYFYYNFAIQQGGGVGQEVRAGAFDAEERRCALADRERCAGAVDRGHGRDLRRTGIDLEAGATQDGVAAVR